MDSTELNTRLSDLDEGIEDSHTLQSPNGLQMTGKAIPYIGWYWRSIDWDYACEHGLRIYAPTRRAKSQSASQIELSDVPPFYGFMQNNKWGYNEVWLNSFQARMIREYAENLVSQPSQILLDGFFELIQREGEAAEKQEAKTS